MLRHRTVTAYLKSKQVLALQWLMQIAADTRIAPEMYNTITYAFLTAHNLLTKSWTLHGTANSVDSMWMQM